MTTQPQAKPKWPWIAVAAIGLLAISSQCDTNKPREEDSTATATTTHAATTTKAVPDYNTIPGNGTHEMGGVDGKNWGVYTATVPAGSTCQWSIRSVAPYRGGEILDEGQGESGETVQASIQPDGDVSTWTGMINDDHRIVFMTSGCGAWTAS